MTKAGLPPKQGLYDPQFEHDACGVGFVVNIKGEKSREIVEQALTVLQNLDHRGACGCEENTGDGAGILIQIPHTFFQDACAGLGFHLTDPVEYGVGMIFLPDDRKQRRQFEKILEQIIAQEGQKLLGWRKVPTDNLYLGDTAKACEPFVRQVFIGRGEAVKDDLAFERKLYVIRRRAENAIRYAGLPGGSARILFRAGAARTPIAISSITERSTRCAATKTGCTRGKACWHQNYSGTT